MCIIDKLIYLCVYVGRIREKPRVPWPPRTPASEKTFLTGSARFSAQTPPPQPDCLGNSK